jgi:hypothetical protein
MNPSLRLLAVVSAGLIVVACSSSSGSTADPGAKTPGSSGDTPPPPGTSSGTPVSGAETWEDGKELSGAIVIDSGAVVTIAPGAALTVVAGTSIVVKGTLTVKSDPSAHAKISGASWKGITVSSGGKASLDGLDIANAEVAVQVDDGGTATYDNGSIVGTPFGVAKGGTLSTKHAGVTAPKNPTTISGAFTASYLDYDEKDTHAIIADDPAATVSIEDSTFHSTGKLGPTAGPDLLTVNAATSFHIAYSDISGAHCGFHFEGSGAKIEIDHVTVKQVSNGADLWGLASGKHSITNSNFAPVLSVGFDESGTNGSVSVSGCYIPGKNNLASSSSVSITSPAQAEIANAHPR